jgi:hypothetical protein
MTIASMQSESRPAFQQAAISVEKLEEFAQLQSALRRVFDRQNVESFLRLLQRKGVPIRDFDRILNQRLIETADSVPAKGGKPAKQLYDELSLSDRAQIREFYLTALEEIELPLREKYNKLYRYY